MSAILTSLRNTIIAGIVLMIGLILVLQLWHADTVILDRVWWTFIFRWMHVLSAIMWVGLLFYFNFVQIPNMPRIPDEQKPAIGKVIAPAALFWFRWAAMATVVTGIVLAALNGYLLEAAALGLTDGVPKHTVIGIGMWLGVVMWFNVWMIIWPNQKRALGLVDADADTRARSARVAMLTSRTNTVLAFPMLYAMVSAQNIY